MYYSSDGRKPNIIYSPAPKRTHTCSFFDYFDEVYSSGTIGQCQCGQYAIYCRFGWKLISEKKANKILAKVGLVSGMNRVKNYSIS